MIISFISSYFINLILSSWLIATPLYTNLQHDFPPVFEQERLKSCSSNAVVSTLMYKMKHENKIPFPVMKSRLDLYWNSRFRSFTPFFDSGSHIKDALETLKRRGICDEATRPYVIQNALFPSNVACAREAHKTKITNYGTMKLDIDEIKRSLLKKNPIIIDFQMYESLFSKKSIITGHVQVPTKKEKYLGNHAIVITGFNDITKTVIARNSWGYRYDTGNMYFPYEYFTPKLKLINHLYVINAVTLK
uniref:Peptidase C1A papain C-terminal domain-containing protein n=1 Tax=viral metagenome TaxID=1070528 RepID=A0A6C0CR06_9ZZZZ